MRKSCSNKESRVVRNDEANTVLLEQATDKQVTGKKIELGADGGELGWWEKGNSTKNTSTVEKLQRTSPRLAKTVKAGKWINTFDEKNQEDNILYNKCSKEFDLSKNLSKTNTIAITKDGNSGQQETRLPSNKLKKEQLTNEHLKSTCEISEVSKTTQFEVSFKDKTSNFYGDSEGNSPSHFLGKKRLSQIDKTIDSPKKIKMEETNNNCNNNINNNSNNNNNNSNNNSNINNNELPSTSENMLQIELELEKIRKNSPFHVREIKTIVAECELRNKKWKETYLKYKCPTHWGVPIVKNCSEKWDGKEIPPKLLRRYQKYLMSKNRLHSAFLVDTNLSSDENSHINNDSSEHVKTNLSENTVIDHSNSQELLNQDDLTEKSVTRSDNKGRMVLRNRNQYKPVVIEEDESLSDDSDDWGAKQKSARNKAIHKANVKNRKNGSLNNQQLVSKLERCNINKNNGTNIEDDDLKGYNSLRHHDVNSKPESETMVCPICSLRFPKQLIESHATECATKTFKD